jgi:hypothetical protein
VSINGEVHTIVVPTLSDDYPIIASAVQTASGGGIRVIRSQARQVNFSRTVWITFQRRGSTSSVSVTSSPSLASLPPQQGHAVGSARRRAPAADAPAADA